VCGERGVIPKGEGYRRTAGKKEMILKKGTVEVDNLNSGPESGKNFLVIRGGGRGHLIGKRPSQKVHHAEKTERVYPRNSKGGVMARRKKRGQEEGLGRGEEGNTPSEVQGKDLSQASKKKKGPLIQEKTQGWMGPLFSSETQQKDKKTLPKDVPGKQNLFIKNRDKVSGRNV